MEEIQSQSRDALAAVGLGIRRKNARRGNPAQVKAAGIEEEEEQAEEEEGGSRGR